jgi:hypothetical protein
MCNFTKDNQKTSRLQAEDYKTSERYYAEWSRDIGSQITPGRKSTLIVGGITNKLVS